jgi:hypothetical protein
MAAATEARDAKRSQGLLIEEELEAGDVVYKGTLGMRDSDGYIKDGADTASHTFAGVFDESKSNAGAADGAEEAKMWKSGVFEFVAASATQAWLGVTVYIVDNQTVALAATTTNDIAVGKVVKLVSASLVRVRIDGFAF